MMTEDLKGIKNALKFLIKCKMDDEISNANCDIINSHSYKNGDEEKTVQRVKNRYKLVLDGLK